MDVCVVCGVRSGSGALARCCRCAGCFFFQAEDGIRDLVRSRGLGDVYKRQGYDIKYQLKVSSSIFLIDHSE